MPPPENKEIVVTLYEKDYHLGVAALINSLYKSKYDGLVLIGYKDKLPPWMSQLGNCTNDCYQLDFMQIQFRKVVTPLHFGFYKPTFLKEAFQDYSTIERGYYFDPDIVVNSPWSFFSGWADSGVCLCLDNCFYYVHKNHPWREAWKRLANVDESLYNYVDYYVNSGFIGIHRNNLLLLDRWIDMTDKYCKIGGDITVFQKDGYRSFKGDQDLLNAVITTSADIKFSIIGTEGMGFTQPSYLMSHAVMRDKPWKKNFLYHLIKHGNKPDNVEKDFFDYCEKPINIFPKLHLFSKKFNLTMASFLGRIISINH